MLAAASKAITAVLRMQGPLQINCSQHHLQLLLLLQQVKWGLLLLLHLQQGLHVWPLHGNVRQLPPDLEYGVKIKRHT